MRLMKLAILSSLFLMVASFLHADDPIVDTGTDVTPPPIVDTGTDVTPPPIVSSAPDPMPPVVMDTGPFDRGKSYLHCSSYSMIMPSTSLFYTVEVDTLAFFPHPITGAPVQYCKVLYTYSKYWKVTWLDFQIPGTNKVYGIREDGFQIAVSEQEYRDYLEGYYSKRELIDFLGDKPRHGALNIGGGKHDLHTPY